MELAAGQSRLHRTFARHHRDLKSVEEEVKRLMQQFLRKEVSSEQIERYLEIQYPEHFDHIFSPPSWISMLKALFQGDDDGDWQRVGKDGHYKADDNSSYEYWRTGQDLAFLAQPPRPLDAANIESENAFDVLANDAANVIMDNPKTEEESSSDDETDTDDGEDDEDWKEEPWELHWTAPPVDIMDDFMGKEPDDISKADTVSEEPWQPQWGGPRGDFPEQRQAVVGINDLRDPVAFFANQGFPRPPLVPTSDHTLEYLLSEGTMWSFSLPERRRLHDFWTEEVRVKVYKDQMDEFERLRNKHAEIVKIYNEGKDEVRRGQFLS